MRSYKGFTEEERLANLKRVKAAIKAGELDSPFDHVCEICGQDKGIREWHCKDYTYEVALQSLQCLCYKCHRNLHVYELGESHKYYKRAKAYFDNVEKGVIFQPVYSKWYTQEMENENANK